MKFFKVQTVAIVMIALASACAGPRGELGFLSTPQVAQNVEQVFVATSRTPEPNATFGTGRSSDLSLGTYDISIPPTHEAGKIEWPKGDIDPETDFAIVRENILIPAADFKSRLNRAIMSPGAINQNGKREVTVFVHGFNTNYAEALYRIAQLKSDYNSEVPAVLYSWPSAARLKFYAYDRDSALFARNGLEELLELLADSNAQEITLVAHSLGTEVLLEALRQIYRDGNPRIRSKIALVLLLSPDIDIDVFNSQIADINPLPQPFVILGSKEDKALGLMRLIAGGNVRLGDNMDISKINSDEIDIVDLSEFTDGDKFNHFALATSPTLIADINRLKNAGESSPAPCIQSAQVSCDD